MLKNYFSKYDCNKLVYGSRVKAGSLRIECENLVFWLEEGGLVSEGIQFAEWEGYHSSSGKSVFVAVLPPVLLFYVFHLNTSVICIH